MYLEIIISIEQAMTRTFSCPVFIDDKGTLFAEFYSIKRLKKMKKI